MWGTNAPSKFLTSDEEALILQGVSDSKNGNNNQLSQDEVHSLFRGVTGEMGYFDYFDMESPHTFTIGQEVFIIAEAHRPAPTPISPMPSIERVQIENICDNSIATSYRGDGKILGVYHTSEEANKELASNIGKIIERVQQTLDSLLTIREIALAKASWTTDGLSYDAIMEILHQPDMPSEVSNKGKGKE